MSTVYIVENKIRYVDGDVNGITQKNHINGIEFREWLQLDEAINPINTEYGRWPEMSDANWHIPNMYNYYTMFEHAGLIFVISIIGDDLSFSTVSSSKAKAIAKQDWEKVISYSSTTKTQDINGYAEAANAFGKVLYVVGQFLDMKKPNQLTYSNASSKLGSLYARAFTSKSVKEFFKKHNYTVNKESEEEIGEYDSMFGKLTTYSITRNT